MSQPSPREIADQQLHALHELLGDTPSPGDRLAIGNLAAQLAIADRLAGIEKSLDLGISVRTSD
jgi:hypothetical protein